MFMSNLDKRRPVKEEEVEEVAPKPRGRGRPRKSAPPKSPPNEEKMEDEKPKLKSTEEAKKENPNTEPPTSPPPDEKEEKDLDAKTVELCAKYDLAVKVVVEPVCLSEELAKLTDNMHAPIETIDHFEAEEKPPQAHHLNTQPLEVNTQMEIEETVSNENWVSNESPRGGKNLSVWYKSLSHSS